ncbi:protein sneaky-like [Stegodyphus dumicola]|uniref:protein sneaky-like n=1 Tax=Stegodyphus dumicola TaxID=202533 RepID=UPI0015A9D647|nr:protein sneaky-like [Stegodyphus dumicola]
MDISSKEKAEIHRSKRPKISSKELSAVSDDKFEVSEEQSEISGEGVSYTSSEISSKEQLTDAASEEMLDISDEEKAIVDEENADISSESEISEMEGEISEEGKEYEEERKRSTVIDIPETEPPTVHFRKSKHMIYRKKDRGFGKFCQCLSPCIARLLYSKRTEYRAVKAMLGFPIGCLFGYILYKLVIERLELGPFTSWILGCILAMFLGVGYAFSTQVRCMCFLAIPSFFGKTGRAYVSTYVITFVITGPVSNLLYNAGESMRVLSCIASLNLNHTMERFKLMFVPVKEIVWDFVGAGKKIQDDTKEINSAYKTIEDEVRDENELKEAVAETKQLDEEIQQESRVDVVKRKFSGAKDEFGNKAEKLYGMKSELRCEGIFTKGVKGCYNSFEYAYDKCHHHLPVIGYLLCWPMKLTFICDIGGYFMKKRTCDSDVVMNPGFGESVETAEGVQREFDKDFGVSMQYKGKLTLLPLKKGEKLELFNPFTVKYSAEEKGFFILSTVRLLGELMTISVILLFDWTFYEFLMLIQRHAHVSYKQTGVHHIKMTVFGDGFVGNMVRSILKGFDKKHTTDQVTSTAECLPLPRKLERRAVIELYLIFLLMFILMAIEAYALRLRRVICAFFYPKREKKRILYLYNDRMKKRRAFLQHMRARVRKAAREQAIAIDSGVLFSLRHLYPKYFGWLGKLGLGKKKCLVCEEVESRKIPFIMCSDECPFCYCPECWIDIKRKCFVCLPDDDEDSAITEDDLSDFE